MTLKVTQGHKRPLLCQNHYSTFVYGPILMKICMNANIIKTQENTLSLCHYNLDLRSYGQLLSLFVVLSLSLYLSLLSLSLSLFIFFLSLSLSLSKRSPLIALNENLLTFSSLFCIQESFNINISHQFW